MAIFWQYAINQIQYFYRDVKGYLSVDHFWTLLSNYLFILSTIVMSGILGQIAHKFIEGSVGVIVDENLKGIAERERYHQTGNRKNTGPFQTEFEKKREEDIQNHNIRINSEVDFCENNYIEISSRLENKHLFQIVGPCYIKVISTSTTITPRQSTKKKFTNYILDRLDAIFVVIFIIIILVVIYFLLHLVLWLFDLLPIF